MNTQIVINSLPKQVQFLMREACTLSSGTYATLTGYSTYAEVEKVEIDFVDFLEENQEITQFCQNWKTAWSLFADTRTDFIKACPERRALTSEGRK